MTKTESAIRTILEFGLHMGKGTWRPVDITQLCASLDGYDPIYVPQLLNSLLEKKLVEFRKWSHSEHDFFEPADSTRKCSDFFLTGNFEMKVTVEGQLLLEVFDQQMEARKMPPIKLSRPVVFVSCGQVTNEERDLGRSVCKLIEDSADVSAYFAENQSSPEGVSSHILRNLAKCTGFVGIMHERGIVQTPVEKDFSRGSVWIEQEVAIIAYRSQIDGKEIPLQLYIREGIKREGLRDKLLLNPLGFRTNEEVIEHLRSWVLLNRESLENSERYERDLRFEVSVRRRGPSGNANTYILILQMENTSTEVIQDFYIEVCMPSRAMQENPIHVAEVKERRSSTHRFFRYKSRDSHTVIYPAHSVGKELTEFVISNVATNELDSSELAQEIVSVEVFCRGRSQGKLSRTLGQLIEADS